MGIKAARHEFHMPQNFTMEFLEKKLYKELPIERSRGLDGTFVCTLIFGYIR
jgi:hypothetical protein